MTSPERTTATAPADPPPRPPELLDQLSSWLIGGRWLLVVTETIEAVLHLALAPSDAFLVATLAVVFVYNCVTLVLVHRYSWRRLPIGMLLGADLFFVTLVALQTGGVASPFLGQCYLIIFFAALCYGLPGGLLAGCVSAGIAVLTAFQTPEFLAVYVRDRFPYFIAAGAFAGHLADRLQRTLVGRWQAERAAHEQALETAGSRREMELAREVQLSALPTATPDVPGWQIAARLDYPHHVGGDFYLFVHEGERWGAAVGDVCGKGMPAALSATSIGYLLPSFHPLKDPAGALARLNDHLGERMPDDSFVTLALALLQADGGIEVWSAGHPPPLVWRAGRRHLEEADTRGPLLGVLPAWVGRPYRTRLRRGDALILYTDGLTETRDAAGFQFETGGVATCLHRVGNQPATLMAEEILAGVSAWGTADDDVTLVVCRYVGPASDQESSPSRRRPSGESSAGG